MLTIDRKTPSFVARAVGVLSGRLIPDREGKNGIVLTHDGAQTPLRINDGAFRKILADPSLLGGDLDFLVWPRTAGMDLCGMVVDLEPAADKNPDRDLFLIQGMALTSKRNRGIIRIGIKPNTSDRNNRSNFEKFWLNLHGHLKQDLTHTVYQVKAKRRGNRLFIIESNPHIRTKKGWQLLSPEPKDRELQLTG